MRSLSAFLLLVLLAPAGAAQHRDGDHHRGDRHRDGRHHDHHEDDKRHRHDRGLMLGLSGSALVASGDIADDFGETTLGIHGAIGYQANQNLTAGVQISGYELEELEEFAETDSGLLLDVTTTTSLTRVAAFVRYGAPFGPVTPFVEGHAGVDVITTTSRLGDASSEGIGQTQEESVAPAFGGGIGAEIGLGRWPLALQIRASHTIGGEVDYLLFEPEVGLYGESSGTATSTELSVGITYRLF